MGWRPSSWWARSRDRQPSADVPAEANGPEPGPAPVPVHDAWRDLPALTLTTAAPVQRVAITDDLGRSLATHTDPRFLRPLTHWVDPTIGGLVDGLALPGKPHSYDDGPDLAVLPRPVPSPALRVQRQVAWLGSSDLATVRWEAPTPAAAAEWSAEPEDPAPVTVPDVDVPAMQRADVDGPAMQRPDAGSVTGSTVVGSTVTGSTADGGTAATAAVVTVDPPRRSRPELPIVLQRSLPATTEPPPLNEASPMTSASAAAPTPPADAEPVVAPLTGSAVAAVHDHARSVVGATPDAGTARSVIAGTISAPADRPLDQPTATTQPLQRSDASSTVRSRPVISETSAAAHPTRPSSPSASPSLPSGSFPTVSSPTESFPTEPFPTAPFPTESPSTPSLPTESPSTPSFSTPFVPTPPVASSQSAVVGLRSVLIGAPIHQRVQRIATVTEPPPELVRPRPDQPGPDRPWPARARPDPRPEPDQPLVGSSPVAAAGIASPGRSFPATEAPAPAATPIVAAGQPGHGPRASGQIPAVQRQVGSPTVATPAAGASTAGEVATGTPTAGAPTAGASSVSAPIVTAPPLAPPAAPPAGRGIPTASVPTASSPATFAPSATSLAVGIPFVQRSSPGPVETVSTADTRHTTRVPGTGMSFTSMFAAPTAATDAIRPSFEDASPPSSSLMTVPSLQRDTDVATPAVDTSSDIPASAPSTDAGRETQPGPIVPAGGVGSVAPAPAAAPADLDEMARRLYEPLVARLRAELWLDRERAGVFGSG